MHASFPQLLRQFRQRLGFSQQALSEAAGLSQRHLSFMESGKSAPSRQMVIRLSECLKLPLAHSNELLLAAGFASEYPRRMLEEEAMSPIRDALKVAIKHHEPYPAYVLDRNWNVLLQNEAVNRLLAVIGPPDELWHATCGNGPRNLMRLTFHPAGLHPYISNWPTLGPALLDRVRQDVRAGADPALLRDLFSYGTVAARDHWPEPATSPVLSTNLNIGPFQLKLFSLLSKFAHPLDLTLDEIILETFFPADAESAALIQVLTNATQA